MESGQILEPRSVNEAENVILGLGLDEVHVCGAKINLGVSLNSILSGHQNHKPVLDKIQADSQNNAFVIFQSQHENEINILVLDNCQPKDYLKAYITAFMMAFAASKSTSSASFSDNDFAGLEAQLAYAGWRTTHLQINPIGWVGTFKKSV